MEHQIIGLNRKNSLKIWNTFWYNYSFIIVFTSHFFIPQQTKGLRYNVLKFHNEAINIYLPCLVESANHLAPQKHDHLFTINKKRFTVDSHAIDLSGIPLSEKVVRCNIPFYSARPDSFAESEAAPVFRFAQCVDWLTECVCEWEEKFHHANENARAVAPPHSAQVTATSINRRAKRPFRRFREIPKLKLNLTISSCLGRRNWLKTEQ